MSSDARDLGKKMRDGRRGQIDPEAIARDEYGLEVVTAPLPVGRDYYVTGKRLVVADGLTSEWRSDRGLGAWAEGALDLSSPSQLHSQEGSQNCPK